jgi:hypothetical protein
MKYAPAPPKGMSRVVVVAWRAGRQTGRNPKAKLYEDSVQSSTGPGKDIYRKPRGDVEGVSKIEDELELR